MYKEKKSDYGEELFPSIADKEKDWGLSVVNYNTTI